MGNFLFDLTGKTALVTGSSKGIGKMLARGLGTAGARLVLNGTDEERLDQAVRELCSEGLTAYGSLFDVTDRSKVEEKIMEIHASIGPVDILVNNAGIQKRGPLETFELQDWQHIMDVNLTSPFVVAQCVAKSSISALCRANLQDRPLPRTRHRKEASGCLPELWRQSGQSTTYR